ncbi:MAG: MoxR family ATPase [Lachnospiraceae bacterium]|nr:MoxR family ATPase [Lachnospiraceae bacterium]
MNIQEARTEIIRTIRAYTAKKEDGTPIIPSLRQRPLLLIGPPGIGKTAIMEQAARECLVGFVSYTMTHHTRQSALGLPYIERRSFNGEEYAVTEYTMSEIIASVYRCMEETGVSNGLLFLDEINCVSETLAPAMLQFLQNKTFGSHRLPDGWVLAAAGNPPEYNKSVHEFDIATLDRLKYIPVEADYESWRSYALGEAIHGAILAYLDTHPGQFYILKQTYASRAFATARGWEDLSCILKEYETLDFPVDAKLVVQYLQDQELAEDFSYFYQLYRSKEQHLPVAQMLTGEKQAAAACRTLFLESPFEEQIYLVHLMLSCIDEKLNDWRAANRQKARFQDAAERLMRFQKQQSIQKDLPKGLQRGEQEKSLQEIQSTQSTQAMQETQSMQSTQAMQGTQSTQSLQGTQSIQETMPTQSIQEIVDAFLEKEREILKIRRDHGLSPDSELEEMRQALSIMQRMGYRLREEEAKQKAASAAKDQQTNRLKTPPYRNTAEDFLRQGCTEELRQMENDCTEIAGQILEMLKYGIQTILPAESNRSDRSDNSGESGKPGVSGAAGNSGGSGKSYILHSLESAGLVFFLSSLRQNPLADRFFKQYPQNPCAPYWEQLDFSAREKAIREMLA